MKRVALLLLIFSATMLLIPKSSNSPVVVVNSANGESLGFYLRWLGYAGAKANLGALANVTLKPINTPVYPDTPIIAYWQIQNLPLTSELRIFNDSYWNGTDLAEEYTGRTRDIFKIVVYRPTISFDYTIKQVWAPEGILDNSSLLIMQYNPEEYKYYAFAMICPQVSTFKEFLLGKAEGKVIAPIGPEGAETFIVGFGLPYLTNITSIRISFAIKNVNATRMHILAFCEENTIDYGAIQAGGYYRTPLNYTSRYFGILDVYYLNETGQYFFADVTNKYFNYTVVDDWMIFDIDIWRYLGGIQWILDEIATSGAINIAQAYIGFSVVANGTILIDRFYVTISGEAVSPYKMYNFVFNDREAHILSMMPENVTAKRMPAAMEFEGEMRFIEPTLRNFVIWVWSESYQRFDIYIGQLHNTTEEIASLVYDLFNNTPAKFVKLTETKMYIEAEGTVTVPLSKTTTNLVGRLKLYSDVPCRIEKILAPSNITSVVIVENGGKYVRKVYGGEVLYKSVTTRLLDIEVRAYPLTPVHIKVVDARGREVDARVILINKETGTEYVTESGKNIWIESGTYEAKVTVLLYEQEYDNVIVTLYGGVLTLRLSEDIRIIAGESLRALLIYTPVALIIPIAFVLSATPFIVRKRKK